VHFARTEKRADRIVRQRRLVASKTRYVSLILDWRLIVQNDIQ
jgi:hypothetical protein